MTTDELRDSYNAGYDNGYDGRDNMYGLYHRHLSGLEAVATLATSKYPNSQVSDGKLKPELIGRLITIGWSGLATSQAITARLAAYTEIENYGFRVWFEGTHHEGYLLTDAFTVTVHGGAR